MLVIIVKLVQLVWRKFFYSIMHPMVNVDGDCAVVVAAKNRSPHASTLHPSLASTPPGEPLDAHAEAQHRNPIIKLILKYLRRLLAKWWHAAEAPRVRPTKASPDQSLWSASLSLDTFPSNFHHCSIAPPFVLLLIYTLFCLSHSLSPDEVLL